MIVVQPVGRDSAPLNAAGAQFAHRRDPGAIVLALNASQAFLDEALFHAACVAAREAAAAGYIITFGIPPSAPDPRWGYILRGEPPRFDGCHVVDAFVEKPDVKTATSYVAAGSLWNTGNLLFCADTLLGEFTHFEPAMAQAVEAAVERAKTDLEFVRLDAEAFASVPRKSIDYAIMEKTKHAAVVEGRFRWSDLGTWDDVFEMGERDEAGNVVSGPVTMIDTRDCVIHAEGRLTVALSVKDLVVVTTPDAVLVMPRGRSELVKDLVYLLKEQGRSEASVHRRSYRPWGHYDTLNEGDRFQIKHLVVKPNAKLALQHHYHRAEHWIVLRGTAEVRIGDGINILHESESIFIPVGSVHRLANPGRIPLEMIAVQTIRTISANFSAERFALGEPATLTIVLSLPSLNPVLGRRPGEVTVGAAGGPVQVILEAQGFSLISEHPRPILVPVAGDTVPLAFELRIEEQSVRWLHVLLTQEGQPVGEFMINNFPSPGAGPAAQTVSSPIHKVSEADLMLAVRTKGGRIEVSSPRNRACLDHVTITGFKYPETPFRDLLSNRLRALYDPNSDPEATARELMLVGAELATHLPQNLIELLRRPDIQSVMLRHEEDFDFPLELVYLDDTEDPFFVGDRISVCRWYLGVANLPDMLEKPVGRAAFLKGSDNACAADEALLKDLFEAETFERSSDVVEKVFKTAHFDLIHFTGHCRRREDGATGGLELADGTFLRLIEIGRLESERAFTTASPFVMLNTCASAQPYLGVTQHGSFTHRFITSKACAVVGTLWPVSGPVANDFAKHFYTELATKPIGRAMLDAKLALVNASATGRDDRIEKIARQLAARSYCLFANPDLQLLI
jgi:mannose-1-phosphate guanylyltransferase / mannose-6-phosphate isomerase